MVLLCSAEYIVPSTDRDVRLKTPRAKAVGVLSGASTLPVFLGERARQALVWLGSDFRTDALWHEGCPCFGASAAPHSHVGRVARVLSAGAPPHLPNTPRTGHTRGWDLLDRDRRPETPNRGLVGWDRPHRRTDAIFVRAASRPWFHSYDRTAKACLNVWEPRSGCRPYLQRCVSTASQTALVLVGPHSSHTASATPCKRSFRG
jgi:hypothetical protein